MHALQTHAGGMANVGARLAVPDLCTATFAPAGTASRAPTRVGERSFSWRDFVVVLCLLISTRADAAECLSPVVHSAERQADGTVSLTWVHPSSWADTIRAHTGQWAHAFTVSNTYTDIAVAWKLPSFTMIGMISKINAYFSGKAGTTGDEWPIHASFAWSLHFDSAGVPGQLLYPENSWALGDSVNLRSGGWFERPLEWWLPESMGDSLWLVGRWPENAEKVVMLGADNSVRTLPTLARYRDEIGLHWDPVYDPGLLVEITYLRNEGATPPPVPVPAWLIQRDHLIGQGSPGIDTITLPALNSYVWRDSAVVAGQTVRYGVAAACDSGAGPIYWTAPIAIDATTDVADDSGSDPQSSQSGTVIAVQNPFSDAIILRVPVSNITPAIMSGLTGAATDVEVSVYNVLGQRQKTARRALDAAMPTGVNEITVQIDGTAGWPAGVYFCRVRVGDRVTTVKLVHIR